jgi:ABC-type sugar transport system ATPase subunit
VVGRWLEINPQILIMDDRRAHDVGASTKSMCSEQVVENAVHHQNSSELPEVLKW